MAKQEQVQKQKAATRTEEVEETKAAPVNQELADSTEETLANIDDLLEENAQEFVQNYVQQGGE